MSSKTFAQAFITKLINAICIILMQRPGLSPFQKKSIHNKCALIQGATFRINICIPMRNSQQLTWYMIFGLHDTLSLSNLIIQACDLIKSKLIRAKSHGTIGKFWR
jgi:hypothetical protein